MDNTASKMQGGPSSIGMNIEETRTVPPPEVSIATDASRGGLSFRLDDEEDDEEPILEVGGNSPQATDESSTSRCSEDTEKEDDSDSEMYNSSDYTGEQESSVGSIDNHDDESGSEEEEPMNMTSSEVAPLSARDTLSSSSVGEDATKTPLDVASDTDEAWSRMHSSSEDEESDTNHPISKPPVVTEAALDATSGIKKTESPSLDSPAHSGSLLYRARGFENGSPDGDYTSEDKTNRRQEQEFLQRLRNSIQDANMSKPVNDTLQPGSVVLDEGGSHQWTTRTLKRKRIKPVVSASSESFVQNLKQEKRFAGKKKRIPRSLTGDDVLFTPSEFYSCVWSSVEQRLRQKDPFVRCRMALREILTEDPHSYQLTYQGPKVGLKWLQQQAEPWILYRITNANLKRLVQDGESLLVDVEVSPSRGSLGCRLGIDFESLKLSQKQRLMNVGVWIQSVTPDGQLDVALGGNPCAYEKGCAVLSVAGRSCNSKAQLSELLEQQFQRTPSHPVKLTLCLSKLSDLSDANIAELNVRRQDGGELVLRRRSWIEYPRPGSSPPASLPRYPETREDRLAALSAALSQQTSVEVDVILMAENKTLAKLCFDEKQNRGGLWIHRCQPGGEYHNIFGEKACALGMVMMKASGHTLYSSEQLKAIRANAKEYHEDSSFRATFVFFDGTDLSGIDRSRLVQDRVNPRRRNGQPYPLHLLSKSEMARLKVSTARNKKEKKTVDKMPDALGGQPGKPVAGKKRTLSSNKGQKKNESTNFRTREPPTGKKKRGRPPKKIPNEPASKKARTKENGVNGTSGTETNRLSEKKQDQSENYKLFRDKHRPIFEAEYRLSGIHMNRVFSSMWRRHKEVFGDSTICNDDCLCIQHLKDITDHVLHDYIVEQGKKGINVDHNVRQVGFVKYFVPRFLPKLKKGYPKASPSELITYLAKMWRQHEKQAMYGVRCNPSCECGQAWDIIFKLVLPQPVDQVMGDAVTSSSSMAQLGTRTKDEGSSLTTKILPKHPAALSSTGESSKAVSLIPRKPRDTENSNPGSLSQLIKQMPRRSSDEAIRALSPTTTTHKVSHDVPGTVNDDQRTEMVDKPYCGEVIKGPTDQLINPRTTTHSQETKNTPAERFQQRPTLAADKYDMTFDTDSPLGAYFITVRNGSSTVCQIHSVFERGQAKRDPRIQAGTMVVSKVVGSFCYSVTNHHQLKQYYNDARLQGIPLKLMFVNSNVAATAPMPQVTKDWSYAGNWQGKKDGGWPGGAGIRALLEAKGKKKAAFRPTPVNQKAATEIGSTSAETHSRRSKQQEAVPAHRTKQPSKSLLRTHSMKTGLTKSVKFTHEKKFEIRGYVTGTPASERCSAPSGDETHNDNVGNKNQLSLKESLTNAVQKQSCKDLIRLLETAASSGEELTEKTMQAQEQAIKNLITSTDDAYRLNPTEQLKEQARELKAKKSVLKIYLSSSHWIERAMMLQYWSCLEIAVQFVEVHKSNHDNIRGQSNVLVGRVQSRFCGLREEVGMLPPRPMSEFVMYSDSEDQRVFRIFNNSFLSSELRSLTIEFEEGQQGDPVEPTRLCTFSISLNEIERKCLPDGPSTMRFPIASSDLVSKGEVGLQIRRIKMDSKYIESKKHEAQKGLLQQIESIKRFNITEGASTDSKLSGTVRGQSGACMLHAALQMGMEDAVRKLLQLGSDATIRYKHHGTPLSQALRIRDRAQERLGTFKATSTADEKERATKLLRQEDLYEKFRRIAVELAQKSDHLETDSTRPPGQQQLQPSNTPGDLYGDLPTNIDRQGVETAPWVGNHDDKALSSKNADDTQSAIKSSDRDIVRTILRSTPPPQGYSVGSAAQKSRIGCRLKELFGEHFPDRPSVKAFFDRIVAQGLVIEENTPVGVVLKEGDALENDNSSRRLPSDREILVDLLQSAPSVMGLPKGTATTKCIVGSRLREKYGWHFKDKDSVKAFFARILSNGIATEVGKGSLLSLKLCNPSLSTKSVSSPPITNLPGDLDILRQILRDSPPVSGLVQGTAVRKSIIGSWLKKNYPNNFTTKKDTTAFCERVVNMGVAFETEIEGQRVLCLARVRVPPKNIPSGAL